MITMITMLPHVCTVRTVHKFEELIHDGLEKFPVRPASTQTDRYGPEAK